MRDLDDDAQTFRVAVFHLVLCELAALHAQHLDPLDALARGLAAGQPSRETRFGCQSGPSVRRSTSK